MLALIGFSFWLQTALGQNFPDVPEGHWAAEAVRELKETGLLKGYPDGLFRG
jgi:hypothetical protein